VPKAAETDADALAAPDPDLAAELAVMAEYYAAEPSARPYLPSDHDALRDGLLASFRRHSARLAARAEGDQPCGRGDNPDAQQTA
jgi:hypothetical protein